MKCLVLVGFVYVATTFAHPQFLPSNRYLPGITGLQFGSRFNPLLGNVYNTGNFLQSGLSFQPSYTSPLPVIPTGSYLPGEGGPETEAFYFTTPDEEESTLQINVAPNNKKKTNLVFVRVPNAAPVKAQVIAPPSTSEVNTRVYVLLKNAQHPQPINIPAQVSQIHTKPELFYIKYNNLNDAEQAIQQSLVGQSRELGVQPTNRQAFVRTLYGAASLAGPTSPIDGAGIFSTNLAKGPEPSDTTGSNLQSPVGSENSDGTPEQPGPSDGNAPSEGAPTEASSPSRTDAPVSEGNQSSPSSQSSVDDIFSRTNLSGSNIKNKPTSGVPTVPKFVPPKTGGALTGVRFGPPGASGPY